MFYEAYELFENKKYLESRDMFSDFIEVCDDQKKRFWTLIFLSRISEILDGRILHENLKAAHEIFPERAEILYELGKFYYAHGEIIQAKTLLERAINARLDGRCVRYESDKYFEAPLQILSQIYAILHKHNFQEEAVHDLLTRGNPELYDRSLIEYQHRWSRLYNNSALEFLRAKELKVGEKLVIQLPSGYDGLGDNLVFSHIPRIAKESGKFKEVYLSSMHEYKGEGYRGLVWETNPYLDGIVDEPGTYSEIDMRRVLVQWRNILPSLNLLDSVMLLHGLDDGKRSHRPECYYKTNNIEEFHEKTILDPGSKSLRLGPINGESVIAILNRNGINVDYVLDSNPEFMLEGHKKISASNIYEWADLVSNVKNYICFNSGGYWLASAMGHNPIHLSIKNKSIQNWCPYDSLTIDVDQSTISL